MGQGHHHNHSLHGRNLLVSILLNVLITAAQVIGGIWSGSLALLSDALHNFSDVLSLAISFLAHRLSHKKSGHTQTFGYQRAGIMAAFINAISLIIVALFLIYEAVERFLSPQPIASALVIWLSLFGILANGFSVLLLRPDSRTNLNMKSAYLHLLTDALASVAVLIGGLMMMYFGWFWLDSLLTIGIALYLIYIGYDLLKDSGRILMQFSPKQPGLKVIEQEILNTAGVEAVYQIYYWQLNEDQFHLEARVVVARELSVGDFQKIRQDLETRLLEKYNIGHCTLQPEIASSTPGD